MITDEKRYTNWPDLTLYTKEFKEWIWKLFRKVHARIGHVEEDLAKVREEVATDYQLVNVGDEDETIYALIETHSGEEHGTIHFDTSASV